jgi:AcrR family transcriptional regulator
MARPVNLHRASEGRRPRPRFDLEAKQETQPLATRERLKQSAKRLFASRGFEGPAVREILTEAGEKNGASISYYFGSKEGLIEEIIADLFGQLDVRWGVGLDALPADASIRDLIRMIVHVSTTLDEGEEPTASRLAEAASHQRHPVVQSVMKRLQLRAYDRILGRIAQQLDYLPVPILRQRLIFLTRYFSTIFSFHESAYVVGTAGQRELLEATSDLGNLVDTAVGLLTADVVSAEHLTDTAPDS